MSAFGIANIRSATIGVLFFQFSHRMALLPRAWMVDFPSRLMSWPHGSMLALPCQSLAMDRRKSALQANRQRVGRGWRRAGGGGRCSAAAHEEQAKTPAPRWPHGCGRVLVQGTVDRSRPGHGESIASIDCSL